MVLKLNYQTPQGAQRTCAGCCRPFVRRGGWAEAIVGADSRLYCYDTPCERDARTTFTRRSVAATRSVAA
jgi:hypothetical protein